MPKEKEQKKLKVERIGSSKKEAKKEPEVEVPPASEETPKEETKLEKLQKEAVVLGMPKEDAEKFKDAKLLELAVNALRAATANAKTQIIEPAIPGEDSKIEKHWNTKAETQKAYFDSLPKVRILIPCEGKEKPGVVEDRMVDGRMQTVVVSGAVWSKTFNGYKVTIPKGVYVDVSEAVADNISKELHQIQESNARFSVERLDPTTGKPVGDRL